MAIALILLATAVALYLVWVEPWKRRAPSSHAKRAPANHETTRAAPAAAAKEAAAKDVAAKEAAAKEVAAKDVAAKEVAAKEAAAKDVAAKEAAAKAPSSPEPVDDELTVMGRIPVEVARQAHGDDDDPDVTRVAKISPELLERTEQPTGQPTTRPPSADEVVVDVDGPPDSNPTGPQPRILVSGVARTDTGKKRTNNEDSYIASEEHSLYLVADGMGGYAGGELASQLTCETILGAFGRDSFHGEPSLGRPRRGDELVRAVHMANAAVWASAAADKKLTGMGTTVVGIRFSPNKQRAYFTHVGDSRLYRIRGGVMRQLTRDHTIGEATGATGPFAARLTRAVGIAPLVEVDFGADDPQIGDTYLVCSDGLTKMIDDDTVLDIVSGVQDIEAAANALVAAANERGGRDNVTVVLVRVAAP